MVEEKDLAGCCGIFCGLCTKYQSKASSRCIGCRLGEQHYWCSIYICCVRKRGWETCIECDEYPCARYARRKWGTDQVSRTAQISLVQIKETGLESWLEEQTERRLILENLLDNYNEGRSMSFYCLACILMPPDLLDKAIEEAKKTPSETRLDDSDLKTRAKTVRQVLQDIVAQCSIDLSPKGKHVKDGEQK